MSKYILGLLLCCAAVYAQSGWVQQTSPAQVNLTSVEVINSQTAVAVGEARTILRTTDGGATWSSVNAGTGIRLNAVSFANDSVGVAAGLDGQILFSQNAGISWAVIQEGWAIDYHAAHQLTPSVGFLMGGNAVFTPFGSRTSNGWQGHQDFAFMVDHDGSGNEGDVYGAHFFDDSVGCAAVAVWDGHGAVVKTTDAGQSWATRFWSDHAAFAIDFPTPLIGYVVGANHMFAKSTDAGETWVELDSQGSDAFWDLKFINVDTGWVVGDGGRIGRTNDGGGSGYDQISGVTTTLRSVDFVNDLVGYIVGDGGVILKTTTGGDIVNHPPGAFRRLEPQDDSVYWYPGPSLITFRWTAAHDPDGDTVSYHLYVHARNAHVSFASLDTVISDSLRWIWAWPTDSVAWTVTATDGRDSTSASNGWGYFFVGRPDAADKPSAAQPERYDLSAFPNPFNPTTTLSFSLPHSGEASLSIFSIEGRRVFEKRFGVMSAGEHRVKFDGSALPSGVYISRLETPRAQISRKLVLMK